LKLQFHKAQEEKRVEGGTTRVPWRGEKRGRERRLTEREGKGDPFSPLRTLSETFESDRKKKKGSYLLGKRKKKLNIIMACRRKKEGRAGRESWSPKIVRGQRRD